MQKELRTDDVTLITPTSPLRPETHGGRAKCLQRLIRLDLPVPPTVALSFDAVHGIAQGRMPDLAMIIDSLGEGALISVRPSSEDPDWGGPSAILNIGMCDARYDEMRATVGEEAANRIYLRFIETYALQVARLDPEMFDFAEHEEHEALALALRAYEDEMDEPFPQDPAQQLAEVLRSMARAWEGTTARLLRQAKGAPADAGLGLVVQRMALGIGQGKCGSGVIQFVDATTGLPQVTGRFLSQSQGREALSTQGAIYLTKDDRGPSLEERRPDLFSKLLGFGDLVRTRLREEMQIEFVIENGALWVLDGARVQRSSRALVRVAVDLAKDGIISAEEAVMRVAPSSLSELLHRQVDPRALRNLIVSGIAASPGAATGRIVFTAAEAQASAARGEGCVLIRRETTPDDIRGMHAASAVLTIRGGLTSHAAVIGRGLGLPCVVGASDLTIDRRKKQIVAPDGRRFSEGDIVTVDGKTGEVLAGEVDMLEPALDDAFQTLLGWADDIRDIGVRANADTPADARMARTFAAQGIGLCRTEHMFFEGDRLEVMREMIFADAPEDRRAVLDRLLPMQRDDFAALFEIMQGHSVCIRLFDPPLHEFLPTEKSEMRTLAEGLDLPLADVEARVEALSEYNPMLGMRGVRLGVTVPEIYEMQARAIFEAAAIATKKGAPVVPEIMIPLVSAMREVELVRSRIDAVAVAVHNETGASFDYRLGVMVETPRACLRANDLAQHVAFLSFGTNDLTQMAYGLSRDDAGRFMKQYVELGVYSEDPFHELDLDGVGELIGIGAGRARKVDPGLTLAICGEHGGTRNAIAFSRQFGFDYVSCSPFRVPVARLTAAQLVLQEATIDPDVEAD